MHERIKWVPGSYWKRWSGLSCPGPAGRTKVWKPHWQRAIPLDFNPHSTWRQLKDPWLRTGWIYCPLRFKMKWDAFTETWLWVLVEKGIWWEHKYHWNNHVGKCYHRCFVELHPGHPQKAQKFILAFVIHPSNHDHSLTTLQLFLHSEMDSNRRCYLRRGMWSIYETSAWQY